VQISKWLKDNKKSPELGDRGFPGNPWKVTYNSSKAPRSSADGDKPRLSGEPSAR
jgi:hypothetical protein